METTQATKLPTYDQMMNPLLQALKELGDSGTGEEIYNKVVDLMKLPDDIANISHPGRTDLTEVEYRLMWTRTYLKKAGIIDNPSRGVWALTSYGRSLERVNEREVVRQVNKQLAKARAAGEATPAESSSSTEVSEHEQPEELQSWRQKLLDVLTSLEPAAFERLAQRLLRASGFSHVEVTGRSGDGGIDGKGVLRVGGVISFHVMFQCKRYQGAVTASQIRDFRGAMMGRTDKGLFITTGTFTRDAMREATRDGAPPIDLIDGEQLIDRLKELKLGVRTKLVEMVEVDEAWFKSV